MKEEKENLILKRIFELILNNFHFQSPLKGKF